MSEIFNITEYGAIADGKTINTEAIQKAIDECCEGGIVVIPEGTFLSGAVYLKSDMTLRLEEGAVLLGSENTEDYPIIKYRWEGIERDCYSSLVNTKDGEIKNLTIEGCGKIDARGNMLRDKELIDGADRPGRSVCIRNAENVVVNGVEIRNSPAWCLHFIYCRNVMVDGVRIHTKYDENGNKYGIKNGDGIDVDSCQDVVIKNCIIASQDDCIAIKSGKDEDGRRVGIATENVIIENCKFINGFGVAIGSEMSGGVENVTVRNCEFENSFSIGTVKAPRGRGGVIDGILYDNCKLKNTSTEHTDCEWFRGALYIDQYYSHITFDVNSVEPVTEGTAKIKNIIFSNIELETVGGNAIYLAGLAESKLENIILRNVNAKGKYGMKAYNIDGLVLDNVTVTADEGEERIIENVKYEK